VIKNNNAKYLVDLFIIFNSNLLFLFTLLFLMLDRFSALAECNCSFSKCRNVNNCMNGIHHNMSCKSQFRIVLCKKGLCVQYLQHFLLLSHA